MNISLYTMKKIAFIILCLLSAVAIQAKQYGKPVVSILGDSYSTFENYIPEGNATWYATTPWEGRTDVVDVKQTWWWQLIAEGGYILGVNDSYSGATVSYTGYNGADYSDRSFITRLPRLGSPDILLIFGATNDSWTDGPIGEYRHENLTRGHLFEFRPALGKLLSEAQNRFPGTRIVFIINTELKDEITTSIVDECKHFGIEYIQLEDIDKMTGHPSRKGMIQIKDQVLKFLND